MLISLTLVAVLQYLSETTVITDVVDYLVSKNGQRRLFGHLEMLLLAQENKQRTKTGFVTLSKININVKIFSLGNLLSLVLKYSAIEDLSLAS